MNFKDKLVELGLVFQYLIVSTVAGVGASSCILGWLGVSDYVQVSEIRFWCVVGAFLVIGLFETVTVYYSIGWYEARKRRIMEHGFAQISE